VKVFVRVILPLLAAAVVWLVAGSARAAAPQCDIRGAITFAPNPTLEEPNTSMDVGQADDCGAKTVTDLAYNHGRSPTGVDSADDLSRVALARVVAILDAAPSGTLTSDAPAPLVSRAERDRLERPPR
jgi:hypothetical protein